MYLQNIQELSAPYDYRDRDLDTCICQSVKLCLYPQTLAPGKYIIMC